MPEGQTMPLCESQDLYGECCKPGGMSAVTINRCSYENKFNYMLETPKTIRT